MLGPDLPDLNFKQFLVGMIFRLLNHSVFQVELSDFLLKALKAKYRNESYQCYLELDRTSRIHQTFFIRIFCLKFADLLF